MANIPNPELRRIILDAARHLLIEDGYKNLSMRKIARQVGCSPGTIYLYFDNRDAIFHALMNEGWERLYAAYKAVLTTHSDSSTRLEGLCRTYIEFGLSNPEYYEIMYMYHPMMTERYPKEQYRRARRILELTAETLAACAKERLLAISDPFVEATVLWGTVHGITSLMITQRVDARLDRKELIEKAIQRAVNSLRSHQKELVGS